MITVEDVIEYLLYYADKTVPVFIDDDAAESDSFVGEYVSLSFVMGDIEYMKEEQDV